MANFVLLFLEHPVDTQQNILQRSNSVELLYFYIIDNDIFLATFSENIKSTHLCESINLCVGYWRRIIKWLRVVGIVCRAKLIILDTSASKHTHPPPFVNANLLPQEVKLSALADRLGANLDVQNLTVTVIIMIDAWYNIQPGNKPQNIMINVVVSIRSSNKHGCESRNFWKFPPENFWKFIPIFPEIYTENFPPVQTFQITVYLLTSSLSIAVTAPLSLVVH